MLSSFTSQKDDAVRSLLCEESRAPEPDTNKLASIAPTKIKV